MKSKKKNTPLNKAIGHHVKTNKDTKFNKARVHNEKTG